MTRTLAIVGKNEISTWVNRLKVAPSTINNVIREVRSLFAWASGQGFVPENPIAKTHDLRRKVVRPEPGILGVKEFSTLLCTAHPDILPYFALGGFAVIRPDELLRPPIRDGQEKSTPPHGGGFSTTPAESLG